MTYRLEIEAACRSAWTAEGLSEKTIHAYLAVYRRAERFAAELGTTVVELTPSEVRSLAERWPRSRSSRAQLRTALARVWDATGAAGAPQAVPVPTKPRYRCRALPEPSAAALAAAARADRTPAGLAVLLGLYAGLRREEIARLAWCQLDDGWLNIVGKRDVSASLPLHPVLLARLAEISGDGPYVFPGSRGRSHVTPATVWTWTRRLGRAALGEPVPPHVLRHTAIATLHDRTGDLRLAQEFARHRDPETTTIYTRVPAQRLADAVRSIDYGREP